MTTADTLPRSVKIIRWTARIWSILATVFLLMIFFRPDEGISEPATALDQFFTGLVWLALLGLFIAWRWELVGGIFAIAMLFIRYIALGILRDQWLEGFLVLLILILPPAVLYLIAWRQERKSKK